MLIFDNNSQPIIIESLKTPVIASHFWVLNLEERDFKMTAISYIEETTSASIMLDVCGYRFYVPATWFILVADKETAMVDAVRVSDVSCSDFTAMVYGPNRSKAECVRVRAIDYSPLHTNVAPSLHKNEMLCHPIDIDAWICISPTDPYSRFLKNAAISDFLY